MEDYENFATGASKGFVEDHKSRRRQPSHKSSYHDATSGAKIEDAKHIINFLRRYEYDNVFCCQRHNWSGKFAVRDVFLSKPGKKLLAGCIECLRKWEEQREKTKQSREDNDRLWTEYHKKWRQFFRRYDSGEALTKADWPGDEPPLEPLDPPPIIGYDVVPDPREK